MAQMERLNDDQIARCRTVLKRRKGRYALRDTALFEFGLHTGLRISETLKLTWAHVLDADEQFKDFVCIEAKHLKGSHPSPKPTQHDQYGAPGVIAGKFTVSVPLGPSSPSIHGPELVIAALMRSALPWSPGSAVPRFGQSPTASQWPTY